jgi:hypothetical protein
MSWKNTNIDINILVGPTKFLFTEIFWEDSLNHKNNENNKENKKHFTFISELSTRDISDLDETSIC